MSLTRKLLKELELNDETIERIIEAHVSTVDALRAESSASQQEAERLRTEFDAYRTETEMTRLTENRQRMLRQTLLEHGANEKAVDLMVRALPIAEEDWDEAVLRDPVGLMASVRNAYSALFTVAQPIPTDPVRPPVSEGGALTPEDVRRMSARDINQNWQLVRSALMRP